LLTVTRLSLSHAGLPSGSGGYPQPPEANANWFSVASPGPAGNFFVFLKLNCKMSDDEAIA